jgi:hypothetical protein
MSTFIKQGPGINKVSGSPPITPRRVRIKCEEHVDVKGENEISY